MRRLLFDAVIAAVLTVMVAQAIPTIPYPRPPRPVFEPLRFCKDGEIKILAGTNFWVCVSAK